jgi:hypothetical protein
MIFVALQEYNHSFVYFRPPLQPNSLPDFLRRYNLRINLKKVQRYSAQILKFRLLLNPAQYNSLHITLFNSDIYFGGSGEPCQST